MYARKAGFSEIVENVTYPVAHSPLPYKPSAGNAGSIGTLSAAGAVVPDVNLPTDQLSRRILTLPPSTEDELELTHTLTR